MQVYKVISTPKLIVNRLGYAESSSANRADKQAI